MYQLEIANVSCQLVVISLLPPEVDEICQSYNTEHTVCLRLHNPHTMQGVWRRMTEQLDQSKKGSGGWKCGRHRCWSILVQKLLRRLHQGEEMDT